MKRDYRADIERVKGEDYFFCIPIDEFESIQELKEFVEEMKVQNIGAVLKAEHSNFFNGVAVDVYDKECINPEALKEIMLK